MNLKPLEFWHFGRPSLADIEAQARRCETLGFDGLTLTDSQNLSADTYVAMTLAARATSKLLLGPGVTNPLTRHAAVTAGAIASIQVVSGGRAMLGIGRGDSSLFNIGQKPVSPAAFERYVADVQTYLRGGSLETGGHESKLHWLPRDEVAKVPVDVGATGPKVIGIAARHAERVSFSLGADADRIAWGIEQVRQAVGTEGRMPSLGVYLNVCVHDDVAQAAELVRPGVGIFAHFTSMPGASREHVKEGDGAVYDRLGNYDKARHGRSDAEHAQALPLSFIQRFAVVGPAEDCIAKLVALRRLGIERMFIIGPRADHFGDEAEQAQARFASQVIPALRAAAD
ncbi:MAG: LLM class flavin-dependent oxidoreductase [Alphaproteobacteria bacterium]